MTPAPNNNTVPLSIRARGVGRSTSSNWWVAYLLVLIPSKCILILQDMSQLLLFLIFICLNPVLIRWAGFGTLSLLSSPPISSVRTSPTSDQRPSSFGAPRRCRFWRRLLFAPEIKACHWSKSTRYWLRLYHVICEMNSSEDLSCWEGSRW